MQAGERIDKSRQSVPLPDWVIRMDELTTTGQPYLFILDFDVREPLIIPLAELQKSKIAFTIPRCDSGVFHTSQIRTDAKTRAQPTTDFSRLAKSPVPFETYLPGFEKVKNAIRAGDTYLLNLCYSTHLTGIDSLEEVFEAARAPYKLLVPGRFVLFSPEPFVSIADDIIRTFPMKGTIDAAIPEAESKLLADVKEQEEHATVVDLLRNDLSIVATKVMVNRYRYISEIRTHGKSLLQCSSEISGELRETYHHRYGSLMHAILPAGSVTGAPKRRTVEIIRETELEPRGYYTGVFGVFDGKQLDSAVMIRMIEQREDGFYYRSGGGITYRSRPEDEYQEMIDKVYVPVS